MTATFDIDILELGVPMACDYQRVDAILASIAAQNLVELLGLNIGPRG
jgi:hypothetical protein